MYDRELFKIAADHPMTSEEIGQVLGCYGPDAVTRLRCRKDLRVTVADKVSNGGGRAKNRYKIERIAPRQRVELEELERLRTDVIEAVRKWNHNDKGFTRIAMHLAMDRLLEHERKMAALAAIGEMEHE